MLLSYKFVCVCVCIIGCVSSSSSSTANSTTSCSCNSFAVNVWHHSRILSRSHHQTWCIDTFAGRLSSLQCTVPRNDSLPIFYSILFFLFFFFVPSFVRSFVRILTKFFETRLVKRRREFNELVGRKLPLKFVCGTMEKLTLRRSVGGRGGKKTKRRRPVASDLQSLLVL